MRYFDGEDMPRALSFGAAFGVFAGAMFLLLTGARAWAHGEFNWIMNDPKTAYCCSPLDCSALTSVRQTATGWTFERNGRAYNVPFDRKDVYRSKDHHFYACFTGSGQADLRCFFHPVGGV